MDSNGPRRDPADAPAERDGSHYDSLVRAQEVFEFAPDARLQTDGRGLILAANHAAAALLRCPKEFLKDKPLGLFFANGSRTRFYRSLGLLTRGAGGDSFEAQVARPGDSTRDVTVTVTPEYLSADGSNRGLIGFRWHLADVTDRKQAEATRDLLFERLVTAQEDERRRVSRELHDTFGQLLTALSLGVRAVRDSGPLNRESLARLAAVEKIVGELHHSAHDLAVRLRPTALDDVGLAAALQELTAEWSRRTGVPVSFEKSPTKEVRFPPDVETALYRVVQEALTNVARHAGATRVGVMIGKRDGQAVAVVEDDGRGFDPEEPTPAGAARPALGLIGMRERVALLGGTLEIESTAGEGTTVFARIPVPDASSAGGGSGEQTVISDQ
jgi:signal transduction histidine kinase